MSGIPLAMIFSSYRVHMLGMLYGDLRKQSRSKVRTTPEAKVMKA